MFPAHMIKAVAYQKKESSLQIVTKYYSQKHSLENIIEKRRNKIQMQILHQTEEEKKKKGVSNLFLEEEKKTIIQGLAECLVFMKKMKMTYRNLTTKNIFFIEKTKIKVQYPFSCEPSLFDLESGKKENLQVLKVFEEITNKTKNNYAKEKDIEDIIKEMQDKKPNPV